MATSFQSTKHSHQHELCESPILAAIAIDYFAPDNKYIIAAGFRLGTLSVWDVETGKLLVTINNESSYVFDIEFSPDGTKVVTLHEDGFSRMWDFSAFAPSGVDDYSLYR